MRRFVILLILVPLAAVIVFFSVANREIITVSLDPFHGGTPALAFAAPLFVLLFGALILGLLIGGIAAWTRQGRWRRAARKAEIEAERLRAEMARGETVGHGHDAAAGPRRGLMRFVTAAEIDAVLAYPELIETLRAAFRGDFVVPKRHHHGIARPDGDATLLLMPAWQAGAGGYAGVKIVSVFPGNAARGKPSVTGTYLLLDGDSGEPLAVLDGQALTVWRTAAASALAASYLAAPAARRMVMVGAGALAPRLIAAHASVRPITEVAIWNRNAARAMGLAAELDRPGLRVTATEHLEGAVAEADIVCAATMSREPLIRGAWLRPGVHLDLVGAYNPAMREADDDAITRATVYVDTRAGALAEAGDILQAIASGALEEAGITGDLFDLCRGSAPGRVSAEEITLFKSVGTALEDLAAAVLVYERLK